MESVRAVDRAIDILQALSIQPGGMKIADLASQTGIARPTLYRLVRTLERRTLVRQCADPTLYALDMGIVSLARPWMRSVDVLPQAEAPLSDLAALVDETVALCLYRDSMRVFVREIVSRHALKFSVGVGATETVLRGAGGLAILAFEDVTAQSALLSELEEAGREKVQTQLGDIRKQGYAVSRDKILAGATGVAAPIFDTGGKVSGSVGVYGPTARMTETKMPEIIGALLACTKRISGE